MCTAETLVLCFHAKIVTQIYSVSDMLKPGESVKIVDGGIQARFPHSHHCSCIAVGQSAITWVQDLRTPAESMQDEINPVA